ncbi:MAG: DUF3144 domain-containing protein [Ekhidna sp.]|uniref:DUF3144 domain-containing protein n=1 Tax=Ekhidna sp. TaxID=2608089 RepID=UPI0032EF5397
MDEERKISRAAMADQFIELANDFTKTESKERVGAAIMFAAARYNAFEASSKADDLNKMREDALKWYSDEYKKMLNANIDEIVGMHS